MNLLIVESRAKAKTLKRYLGEGWEVLPTGGHVQTLPHSKEEHGKQAGKAFWANKPGCLPDPEWVWTEQGEKAVQAILKAAGSHTKAGSQPTFWLATDPDREGEFIAWCLERLMGQHGPTHRVSFQEVTEEAVRAAIESPRPVDLRMVDGALLRKFLDRLVGYRTSKLARAVIPGGNASMGRVQTPTLGFVVERELEREAHEPIPYFEVRAWAGGVEWNVRFHEPDDPEAWRDQSGRVVPTRTFQSEGAEAAAEALLKAGHVELTEVTRGSRRSNPAPPFSTDALLQAAGSRFGWSPKKTSALASILYEAGHITYIRTDSTRLAASAIQVARAEVVRAFGENHLRSSAPAADAPGRAPHAGGVQDAHEAIRPTRLDVAEVALDDDDAQRLYRLVRAHTLASQMAPARFETLKVRAAVRGLETPLSGSASWRVFSGWEAAYAEFRAEPPTSPPAASLEVGASWELDPPTDERPNPQLVEDETRPPPRYRPHALIKAMKEAGIGRPSTYASTLDKLEFRRYVEVDEGALAPTERGRAVWLDVAPLYRNDDSDAELFSPDFTASMEARLDAVAQGELPAAETWEGWRDEVRQLHEMARARKKRGAATPRTLEQLDRLRQNTPQGRGQAPETDDFTEAEAREKIRELREAGVKPAPSVKQADYLESLLEQLGLTREEAAAELERELPAEIQSAEVMSAIIDELLRLLEERRPASPKQLRLAHRLMEELGLSPEEAASLVGETELEDLTGGREGTASALIDRLLAMTAPRNEE